MSGYGGDIVGIIALLLMIWGVVGTLHSGADGANKIVWVFVIILLPIIGFLIWYFISSNKKKPADITVTSVAFKKIDTGEIKAVKIGWSWTLFFFGGVFGIPLFMRKVYPYAAAMIGWNILQLLISQVGGLSSAILKAVGFGIAIWLGQNGNKLTAQYYVKHGWELADPASDETRYAREKWNLA